MKKLALAIMVASFSLFGLGLGGAATAQYGPTTTVAPATTAAGSGAGVATTTVAPTTVATTATAPAGGLPATGSGGISTTTGIAIGLSVVGLGMLIVASARRRQNSAA